MRAIIVLGMHRSGTSAVTRAIGVLGAGMGEPRNLRKHWENTALRDVNEQLIALGRGSWDAPPKPGWLERPRARKLRQGGRQAVAEQFGGDDIAVWKDPRTCLTVPFWLTVFEEEPVFLLIHRHPSEVADSLTTRNKLGRGHSFAIWERYSGDALQSVQGRATYVLDYDRLVSDPVGSLARVCAAFADAGVHLPKDPATTEHGLVAQERHHHATAPDVVEDDAATPSQHELFALLRELDGPHRELTLPRPVPPPHPLSLELFELVRRGRRMSGRLRDRRASAEHSADAVLAPPGDDEPDGEAVGAPDDGLVSATAGSDRTPSSR